MSAPHAGWAAWAEDARSGGWSWLDPAYDPRPPVCAGCQQASVDRLAADVEAHIAAARRGWRALLLADELGSPPHWRLAWLLHGLPEPLPREEYAATLGLVERRFGIGTVVRGLRLAAGMPAPHGSGVRPSEFAAIAGKYERTVAS